MSLQELREPAVAAEYSGGQSLSEVQARIAGLTACTTPTSCP